jgi:hypothetical protein
MMLCSILSKPVHTSRQSERAALGWKDNNIRHAST